MKSFELKNMSILSPIILIAILMTLSVGCDAYLSEAAIIKMQKMVKSVCIKKHPVPDEIFDNFKKGEIVDNKSFKCFVACTLKTAQFVSPRGTIEKKILKEKLTMLLPPAVLDIYFPVFEECADKDFGELCENAFEYIKCAQRVNPKTLNYFPV
ncbi:general odorant-binding protein 19a isoform X2 [Daktulosphaira vitifoliae]|uniref:general odorant-binding protein 19a isoform X1 n=1 Tax=Daktulosphaira vitifoliae TaxID=58002 RepID=UPI0021AA4E68|nr:general odorant-binding protein 19a isoform X1 [Daktulosphaira vitifoliae]XP_050548058.1 general odorant-binding protein 19a isoform X2 [Daktulosphaira vitifoliae]